MEPGFISKAELRNVASLSRPLHVETAFLGDVTGSACKFLDQYVKYLMGKLGFHLMKVDLGGTAMKETAVCSPKFLTCLLEGPTLILVEVAVSASKRVRCALSIIDASHHGGHEGQTKPNNNCNNSSASSSDGTTGSAGEPPRRMEKKEGSMQRARELRNLAEQIPQMIRGLALLPFSYDFQVRAITEAPLRTSAELLSRLAKTYAVPPALAKARLYRGSLKLGYAPGSPSASQLLQYIAQHSADYGMMRAGLGADAIMHTTFPVAKSLETRRLGGGGVKMRECHLIVVVVADVVESREAVCECDDQITFFLLHSGVHEAERGGASRSGRHHPHANDWTARREAAQLDEAMRQAESNALQLLTRKVDAANVHFKRDRLWSLIIGGQRGGDDQQQLSKADLQLFTELVTRVHLSMIDPAIRDFEGLLDHGKINSFQIHLQEHFPDDNVLMTAEKDGVGLHLFLSAADLRNEFAIEFCEGEFFMCSRRKGGNGIWILDAEEESFVVKFFSALTLFLFLLED